MPPEETLKIEIPMTDEASAVVHFRRPRHGELDMVMLERLVGVFAGYRQKIQRAEEDPQPGDARRVGSWLALGSDAADEMVKMLRDAMPRFVCPGSKDEVATLVGPGFEGNEGALRAVATAIAIIDVVSPQALLPK